MQCAGIRITNCCGVGDSLAVHGVAHRVLADVGDEATKRDANLTAAFLSFLCLLTARPSNQRTWMRNCACVPALCQHIMIIATVLLTVLHLVCWLG